MFIVTKKGGTKAFELADTLDETSKERVGLGLVSDIMPARQAASNAAFKIYCYIKHCFSCTPGHCNCAIYHRTFA